MVPPAAGTAPAILDAVGAMRFQGKTPLSEAVRQAAQALRREETAATVVLVTDGIETCDADPCAVAAELEATGVDFTAHVIGFGLSRDQGAQIACIAENTGGRYMQARDATSLGKSLNAVVKAETPPAAEPVDQPEAEAPDHHAGAEIMPQVALAPTGGNIGKPAPIPTEVAFPPDGNIEQCRAACDGDQVFGSWRYEPAGSNSVADARCFLFSRDTEFGITYYSVEDGCASEMKSDVVGLVRPYVPVGAQDIAATLSVPDAVQPSAEFMVLWSGPGNDKDWVDLVPKDHAELSGELSFFYVNDTIDATDKPEGAGMLTAPVEAGEYELRYILGRDVDRRVIYRVPIRIGGPAGAPATPAASTVQQKRADADVPEPQPTLVEATFSADTGETQLAITWSAIPAPGQDLPPEAWAMQEGVIGPVSEMFLPGDYEVRGDAGDSIFAGPVKITPEGLNTFVIPYSPELSPAGEDSIVGHSCAGPQPCPVTDATGLSFALPAGWQSDEPFLAETAAGAVARQPTVTFTGPDGSPMLLLNPLQWLESNGTCTDSPAGKLCIFGAPDGAALSGLAVILPSLAYSPDGGQ